MSGSQAHPQSQMQEIDPAPEGHLEPGLGATSAERRDLLLLGVGQTARAVLAFLRSGKGDEFGIEFQTIYGTTRSLSKASELSEMGVEPILFEAPLQFHCSDRFDSGEDKTFNRLSEVAANACVLVSFPPDGVSDRMLSLCAKKAHRIIYISSTGVYGKTQGLIDENSPVDKSQESAHLRLEAEEIWHRLGAIVLRAPGLYDFSYGLHLRLLSGQYRLPGDGTNYVSRIHLEDFARLIVAAFARATPGSTYVVGDLKPSTHLEVVKWLCAELKLPMPEKQPLSEANPTLRGNRQINARKILSDLQVTLAFPTYIEGFSDCLQRARLGGRELFT